MPYQCLDCTHKAGRFPGGECTACGSRNVKRVGKKAIEMRGEVRRPFRYAILVALWIHLAYRVLELIFG